MALGRLPVFTSRHTCLATKHLTWDTVRCFLWHVVRHGPVTSVISGEDEVTGEAGFHGSLRWRYCSIHMALSSSF